MSAAPPPPRPITLASTPQPVTLDLNRTALMVIDMQNDFCTAGGWVDHLGADYRPDLANMPANQHHLYKPSGQGIGLGEPLPVNGAPVLQRDSWAAAVVDDLVIEPTNICVDKHRISGFWDTPLDSILRNLGIRTMLFAGVNTEGTVSQSDDCLDFHWPSRERQTTGKLARQTSILNGPVCTDTILPRTWNTKRMSIRYSPIGASQPTTG